MNSLPRQRTYHGAVSADGTVVRNSQNRTVRQGDAPAGSCVLKDPGTAAQQDLRIGHRLHTAYAGHHALFTPGDGTVMADRRVCFHPQHTCVQINAACIGRRAVIPDRCVCGQYQCPFQYHYTAGRRFLRLFIVVVLQRRSGIQNQSPALNHRQRRLGFCPAVLPAQYGRFGAPNRAAVQYDIF